MDDPKLEGALRLLAEKLGMTPDEFAEATIVIDHGQVTDMTPPSGEYETEDTDG